MLPASIRSFMGRLACILLAMLFAGSVWWGACVRSPRDLHATETDNPEPRLKAERGGLATRPKLAVGSSRVRIRAVAPPTARPYQEPPEDDASASDEPVGRASVSDFQTSDDPPEAETGQTLSEIAQARYARSVANGSDPFLIEEQGTQKPTPPKKGARTAQAPRAPEVSGGLGKAFAIKRPPQNAGTEAETRLLKKSHPRSDRVPKNESLHDVGARSWLRNRLPGSNSARSDTPRENDGDQARAKADGLMRRANVAIEHQRIDEALTYAHAARRIEQAAQLDYGPDEERPSDMVFRLKSYLAERRQSGAGPSEENAGGILPARKSESDALQNMARAAAPRTTGPNALPSPVEFLQPPPSMSSSGNVAQRTESGTITAGATSGTDIIDLDRGGVPASATVKQVARVSANQGGVLIRPAFQAAGSSSPEPLDGVNLRARTEAVPTARNAAPSQASEIPATPAPVLAAAPAPVPATPVPAATLAPLPPPTALAPVAPAPPAAPAAAPVITAGPSAPPETPQPPAIPAETGGPALAVAAPAIAVPPNVTGPGPTAPLPAAADPAAAPPAIAGPAFSLAPAPGQVESSAAQPVPAPLDVAESGAPRRIKDASKADQISLASLIGFVIGIVGLFGLGIWRRLERQHYSPRPQTPQIST